MRSLRAITAADFALIRRRFVQEGLDEDFLDGDDIAVLWNHGRSVDEIVKTAVDYAARTGETAAAPGP